MGQRSGRYGQQIDEQNFATYFQGDIYGQPGQQNPSQRRDDRNLKHPVAAIFHVVFKLIAFLFYIFGGLFGLDFINIFVAVILLVSMDFWVVKNVTGRLLAGLRWSNYIDDLGNSHWIFENKNSKTSQDQSHDNLSSFGEEIRNSGGGTSDASIFWTALIVAPFFWTLFLLISIFRLNVQWFMLVLIASVLSLTNLYGYVRCRLGTSDIKNSVTSFVAKRVFQNFLTGGSSSSTNKPTA